MSASVMLLLGLGCVLQTLRPAATDSGLDTNFYNKTLRAVPAHLPSNITQLTLSHNLIELSEEDIGTLKNYTGLTELHLDGNVIDILPGHAFDSLADLRVLNLSANAISRVEPKAFAGLGALKELDLSHNPLQSLPPGVFAGLASLESLSLHDSGLQSLENDTFTALVRLKSIDLGDNPWNCSCDFLQPIRDSGVEMTTEATCASPKDRAGKGLLDGSFYLPKPTATKAPSAFKTSPTQTTNKLTSARNSSLNRAAVPVPGGDAPPEGNTWKFLAGVLVTALGTSTLLVCAVKAPSWYKVLFNYRHQRLREEEEPNVFTTGRYSTFETEAETYAQDLGVELELEMEDEEDGYIEDRYIETADYKAVEEA